MCHPKRDHGSWFGMGFGFHPFSMFCCDPPTKDEQIAFFESMKTRLAKSIERIDERIAKLKADESEMEV